MIKRVLIELCDLIYGEEHIHHAEKMKDLLHYTRQTVLSIEYATKHSFQDRFGIKLAPI